jgi:chromosome segregation ATPase
MVQPLNLQVFARVEQIAGNLQLEQVERKSSEDALSKRLDGTNTALDAQAVRLDGRVGTVAGDLRTEQNARTDADDALSNLLTGTKAELNHQAARLDARVDYVDGQLQRERDARTVTDADLLARLNAIKAELHGQIAHLREEIEELEKLIAYFEYCAFAAKSPFRELLEKLEITTVEQLSKRDPEELHREMSRITELEPQYQAVPAVRRRRVIDEIIQWSRPARSPSGDNGQPAGNRSASPRRPRRSGGRRTQTG